MPSPVTCHLDINHLINKSQHATNLLEFLEFMTQIVDEGKNMDIVLLDFAKAFDKVPKERLLAKLTANGVGGKVLQWVRNRQEAASGTKWRNLGPD